MGKLKQQERALSRLHLDLLNPRVGRGVLTEQEAMVRLLDAHGDQILALAKDIAQHGLNPLDLWGVVEEGGKTIVVEGNRRLLACRLLLDPTKAPSQRWQQRFKRISLRIHPDEIKRVQCVKAPTRAEMRHWMNLKHQGPGSGEGIAQWTPEMKYLDRVQQGLGREADKEFWYWLETTYSDDVELARDIADARNQQFTTMQRVYDWFLKDKLEARLDGETLTVKTNPDALKNFFSVLMQSMASAAKQSEAFIPRGQEERFTTINSRTLEDAQTARQVLSNIWERTVTEDDALTPQEAVDSTGNNTQTANTDEGAPEGTQTTGAGPSPQPPAPTTGPSRTPTTTNRDKYLYYGVKTYSFLPIRIRRLIEAAHKIDISRDPDLAGVIARVAFELLLDFYAKECRVNFNNKDDLARKARTVLLHLDPTLPEKHTSSPELELKGAWSAVSRENERGHLIKDLNDCIHDPTFTDPQGVATRANRVLTPMMVSMIEKLRNTSAP